MNVFIKYYFANIVLILNLTNIFLSLTTYFKFS